MEPAAKSEPTNSVVETVDYMVINDSTDNSRRSFVLESQQNNEWCDVLLFGKDSATFAGVKGHKMVLASASRRLSDLFKSEGWTDMGINLAIKVIAKIGSTMAPQIWRSVFAIDPAAKVHYIEQIDHATLQTIIDFAYTATLRLVGKSTFVEDRLKLVLMGADFLVIPELVHICGTNLSGPRYLNSGCAVNTWLFAREHHCKVLEEAAVGVICSGLRAIVVQDHFLSLTCGDLVILLRSLAVAMSAADPDLVCEAAIAWLGYKRQERKDNCEEVMREIPLKKISAGLLRRVGLKYFLPEHSLWAIKVALDKQEEIDELQDEKSSLTADLSAAKDLAETRRVQLDKMPAQVSH